MRLIVVAMLLGFLAAQEPELPDGHFCMAGKSDNPRAHECHCSLTCELDENNQPVQREMKDCKAFCKPKQCVCHSDERCSHA